ncbi:MAG: mechanosensitive ion channel family protein [Chloroflexi bacterium]|nr:mechanosensitive ion channel family protein [Chloroflexota bacterium]
MSDLFNTVTDFLGTPAGEWILAGGILVVFILLALLSKFILRIIKFFVARRTKTNLDDYLIDALTGPLLMLLVAIGFHVALGTSPIADIKNSGTDLPKYTPYIHNIFISIYIIIGSFGISKVVTAIMKWYSLEVAPRTKTDIDDKLLPLIKRVINVVVYVLAFLFILSVWGISITPLLAGLGIGGLAVALALQPTLTNFLAGTYVVSDAVIHKGDYISLENGVEGSVDNIGWRTTRLLNWQGSIVIMPNAKLSDAIVTDFGGPEQIKGMMFKIECGVSYNSDLDKVEQVTREVGVQVMQNSADGAKDFEPQVKFKAFADSNIQFTVVLKSTERTGQFKLKHEFIKSLHKRYKEEGIDMEFPARKIYFADGAADANTTVKPKKEIGKKVSTS